MLNVARIRLWLRRCIVGFLCVFILLSLLAAFMQTRPGKIVLSKSISWIVSLNTNYQLEVSGISGFIPANMHIDHVRLANQRGDLVIIEGVDIHLALLQLLSGRIHAASLDIARLDLLQRPIPRQKWRIPRIPVLPVWPEIESMHVGHLFLGKAVLGKEASFSLDGETGPVEGSILPEIHLNIKGLESENTTISLSYLFENRRPQLQLIMHDEDLLPVLLDIPAPLIVRLDGQGERADWKGDLAVTSGGEMLVRGSAHLNEAEDTSLQGNLKINAVPTPFLQNYTNVFGDVINLDIMAGINTKGVLNINSLNISSELIDCSLAGRVQLEEKRTELSFHIKHEDISRVSGILKDAGENPARFEMELRGPFSTIETTAKSFIGDNLFFEADAMVNIGEQIGLQGKVLLKPWLLPMEEWSYPENEDAHIQMDVVYARETGELQMNQLDFSAIGVHLNAKGKAKPQVPSLEMEACLEDPNLAPIGVIIPDISGGGIQADLKVSTTDEGMVFDLGMAAESVNAFMVQAGNVDLNIHGKCTDWEIFQFNNLDTVITGRTKGLAVPGLISGDWDIDTRIKALTPSQIHLSDFDLTDGNIQIAGEGSLDLDLLYLDMTLNSDVAALDKLPVALMQSLGGNAQAKVQINGSLHPMSLEAQMEGVIGSQKLFPEIIGNQLTFMAKGGISDGAFNVTELRSSGEAFTAEGTFIYERNIRQIDSELRVECADLTGVGKALDQNMTGQLSSKINIKGELNSLTAQGTVLGKNIVVNELPVTQAKMDILGKNLSVEPAFMLNVLAEIRGVPVEISTTLSKKPDTILAEAIEVRSGDNRITGLGAYDLKSQQPVTHLEVTLGDLATLGKIVEKPLSGVAEGTVVFQDNVLSVMVEGRSVNYGGGLVGKAVVQARMGKNKDGLSGTATVEMTEFQVGKARIDSLKLSLEGNQHEAHLSTTIHGDWNRGLSNKSSYLLTSDNRLFWNENRMVLDSLRGNIGTFDVELEKPASIKSAEHSFRLEPMDVRFGSGILHFEGKQEEDALSGRLRFDSIPFAVSGLVIEPALSGTLNGEIIITGSVTEPEITSSIKLNDSKIMNDAGAGFNPLEAQIEATLSQNIFSATVAMNMKNTLDLNTKIRFPVHLQVLPWVWQVPEAAPLSGKLEFALQTSHFLDALGIIEHHLEGTLDGSFILAGEMNNPDISGEASMKDGRYENAITGATLETISLRMEASGSALHLVECNAVAGDQGKMRVSGEMKMDYEEHFPFSGIVSLESARFAKLEYLDGLISGQLNIDGNLEDVLVKGDVNITPVHLSMPERLPVKAPPILEVTEIQDGQIVAIPDKEAASLSSRVRLDINCSIPGHVYVRAPILDSEWGGNLHIGGTLADMLADGRISVLRGHLDFLSRRFVLHDSVLLFQGSPLTEPYLDMHAVLDTSSVSARLKLQGELKNVKLELVSEPPLPQDEILAQVLFGRELSRISPVQAIQLARIATMFNRGLAGIPFFSGFIGLPGVDRFDLRTGERADEAVVGIGKYFTDSVYVEVEQGTTTDSGKVSVEVEVTPQISVKGDVDAQERSGIGLFWRKDY
jgi:autotransporter translocation and assembly factor TamB